MSFRSGTAPSLPWERCHNLPEPQLLCQNKFAASADRGFKFQKRSELFIGVHNETFSVAMRIYNPDCSPERRRQRFCRNEGDIGVGRKRIAVTARWSVRCIAAKNNSALQAALDAFYPPSRRRDCVSTLR